MDLNELTTEMNSFVQAMGWYAQDSPKPQTPQNLAKSLMLEAAEVLEHFQWGGGSVDKQAIAGEIADVLLYTLQLASVLSIDLESAALGKIKSNYDREW